MTVTRLLFAPGDLRGAEGVDDAALLGAIGDVESAWVGAQAAAGLISAETRAEAIAGIEATTWDLQADAAALEALAAAAESGGNPVIPYLAAVRARLAEVPSRALHRGLTSQDVMDSALGLLVSRAVAQTRARLEAVTDALVALSDAHSSTLCVARTLTQPAQPTTFGLRAATWAAETDEVRRSTPRIEFVQVGGAVGTRAAIREFAKEQTQVLLREFHVQLEGPDAALDPVPVPWHGNRARVLSWASHFSQCVTLGASIARDVLVGVRPEIGELRLATTGGSSAMPHKLNPTSAVLLHRNGMRAPGAMATVTSAVAEAVEERSDGAWHAEWPALSELMVLSTSSLAMLEETIAALRIDPEAMRRNLTAAGPGIFGERLTVVFGDRLSKGQIGAIIAAGEDDPAARLEAALADTEGGAPPRPQLDELFAPENCLGEAEDIRQAIIAAVRGTGPDRFPTEP